MADSIEEQVEQFFSAYSLREYKKGQVLVFAGDEPAKVLYLITGQIRQYDISYRGDEVVVNIFKPGAFLPMLSHLTGLPNKFFFDAATDIEVREAPPEAVIDFMHENPDVTLDLLRRLYIGVDGLLQRMSHLMAGSAKSRLLFELLLESRRFGKKDANSYQLGLNETELGARAGLSRETVNRELHKLKTRDLLEISSKGILLKDISLLEQELGKGI
jgi:CRP/FNR family transcriptional regulator, cyclic AMP receptor protein